MKRLLCGIKKYPLFFLFGLFLTGYMVCDMCKYNTEYSEMENRMLAQRPAFTLSGFLDNTFTPKYETYVNDQFVWRDSWISLKSRTELAIGKIENNGIVYGKDHYLFEKYEKADDQRVKMNLRFLNEFFAQHPQPMTFAVVPNSYEVLSEKLPYGLDQLDQEEYIRRIYGEIDAPQVRTLDLLPALREHRDEYIYYRTDHHWTADGAYLAYRAYAESMGFVPVEKDAMPGRTDVEGFYGTYFSKCKLFNAVPDVLTYYDIPVTEVTINGEAADGLYDYSKFSGRDKYAGLLHGNNGLTVIRSGNNTAPEEETTRILVIKDSYANSLVPFLTYHYDEVYVVDLRSLPMKMSELMAETDFDEVLVLYNFMNLASDTNIARLRY